MSSEKSFGFNDSEERLSRLCEKTFLSMWSYPNVFKNTNQRNNPEAIGQEICDLLIVFNDVVVVFSDKNCAYKDTGNIGVDWPRWFRRTVQKPASTTLGAQNWIKKHPELVFVDKQCKRKIPIEIDAQNSRFIKIVVAHSAGDACKNHFGGDGSLGVNTMITGREHENVPFFVGRVLDNEGEFVHVLDDATLEIILSSLDTVDDFCKYFIRKEDYIAGGANILAESELDILAHHLMNPEDGKSGPFTPDADIISIEGGAWNYFSNSEAWLNAQLVNRDSYSWDAMIEGFYKHHIAGELTHMNGNAGHFEPAIRHLASANRLKRRILAREFRSLIVNGMPNGEGGFRTFYSKDSSEPQYVLGAIRYDETYASYEQYREYRRERLFENIIKQAYEIKDDRLFVGIVTELGITEGRSEELFAFRWHEDFEEIGKELQAKYVSNKREIRRVWRHQEDQFPIHPPKKTKISRNSQCPCGSGKKAKHCCKVFTRNE